MRTDFNVATAEVPRDRFPAGPPPQVLAEMRRAAKRYEELRAQERQLHFASDPSSGRVAVEVRDLDGNVVRTISPRQALAVISGAPLADDR